MEGTESPFLLNMKTDTKQITELLEKKFSGTDRYLVDLEVKPGKVSVFIDTPPGISIAECTDVHKFLKTEIGDEEFFENYDLEVSSPGLDRPLKVRKQYEKRIGSELNLILTDGSTLKGKLQKLEDNGIAVELNGEKNKDLEQRSISFESIKEAKLILNFGKKLKNSKNNG